MSTRNPRAPGWHGFLPAAVLLAVLPNLHAQVQLSIEQAVAQALAAHPLLDVGTERIASAQGLAQQAGVRPNPRLIIQSENWNIGTPIQPIASTFTDQFLYLSQVVETAGKRGRRVDLGQKAIQVAEADRDTLARQIAVRVKLAYWAAAGAKLQLDLLRESEDNFRQAIAYHEIQLREGIIPEADVLRLRLEGDRVTVAVQTAAREAASMRILLFREMGKPDVSDTILTSSLAMQAPPAALIGDADRAIASRPEVRRAQQAMEQNRANLRLQEAGAHPDVEIVGGYKRTSGFNTVLWGVQFNLPFSNKNQGNIAAATSDIRGAEANLVAVETQVRSEVQFARSDVDNRRLQLTETLAGSLERANESVEIARAAYREGGTDLLRLLDAERVHIELQITNARALAEYQQSLVALDAALGVNP